MSKNFFENVTFIAFVLLFVPFLISVFRYKFLNKIQKRLLLLIVTNVAVESISRLLWYNKINNLPLYHIYTVIEFFLITNIYKSALSKLFPQHFFTVSSILFTFLAILNTLFFQGIFTFNSNMTTLMGLIIIFYSLCYFYSLLKEIKYSGLESKPMFWINSGFLIYFSSNIILFFLNNNLFEKSTEASYVVWGLHAIINMILTIFYTVSVWVKPKKL